MKLNKQLVQFQVLLEICDRYCLVAVDICSSILMIIVVRSELEGTFKDHLPQPAGHAAFDLLAVKVSVGLTEVM